jgi:hypothetical protein
MPTSVVTEDERRAVKIFLENLLRESGLETRWELARAAGVSELSLNEWLSSRGSLPSALNLLRLLQAVGALEEPFRTPIPTRRASG